MHDVAGVAWKSMSAEAVRVWRAPGQDGVLLMHGRTSRYQVDPRGEYIFGLVNDQRMDVCRGGFRSRVGPGQLVAWDPTAAHSGDAVDGRAWTSRLIVVEVADLASLAHDPERGPLSDIVFPDPVVTDPALARSFRRMHQALDPSSTRLEGDERLGEWLTAVIDRSSAQRRSRSATRPQDDRALRAALDMLADQPERNVSLDDLAAAAGIGKFRLVRLFRERTGLPPHALQIAHRVRRSRRLLESGTPIAEAALAVGFADQSHLHRHFRRTLGMTPAQYQRHLGADAQRHPEVPA